MNNKEIKAKLDEQQHLGHPNFKNKIVEMLVDVFNVEQEMAKKTVFHSEIEKQIDSDMIWAQHMGPNFWAKMIMENDLLHKNKEVK